MSAWNNTIFSGEQRPTILCNKASAPDKRASPGAQQTFRDLLGLAFSPSAALLFQSRFLEGEGRQAVMT